MKTLTLSIMGIMCIIATGTILPHAFSENTGGITITSTLVQPPVIQVGDTFAINATITFSYVLYNKTSNLSFDNNATNISKSLMFTISNPSGGSTHMMYSPLV